MGGGRPAIGTISPGCRDKKSLRSITTFWPCHSLPGSSLGESRGTSRLCGVSMGLGRWEKITWMTGSHGDNCPLQGRDLGGPHGSGGPGWSWWLTVHPGGAEWAGCLCVHPVPHTLAPPGPVPVPTGSTWPCGTCPRTSHLLLVLLGSSWCPPSTLGAILGSNISSWSS